MISKINAFLVSTVLLISLAGCAAWKYVALVTGDEVVTESSKRSIIPFTLKGNSIVVSAKINDSREYLFILDTGALTVIRKEIAEELELKEEITLNGMGTSGSSKKTDLVKLDKLSMGDMEVMNCAAGVIDFPPVISDDIAGLLGSNYLRHFIVVIDYQNKNITLSRKGNMPELGDADIKLQIKKNITWGFAPEIKCNVDSAIEATALIDTGAADYVALPLSMFKHTYQFKMGDYVASKGGMYGGLFGIEKESFAFRIEELKIGSMEFYNIPATTYSADQEHIILGNKFLKKFLLVLDYPGGEIILKKNGTPFETNISSYGIGITKYENKTIVTGIWDNSSAALAGIQPGNEIFKINNLDLSALSSNEIMEIFTDEDEKPFEIEFLNDKGRQITTLHKENLLPELE